jgi:hypothetical protein
VGRFVKNQQVGYGNASVRIPVGDASERPDVPDFGQIRFNTDSVKVEYYDGTIWSTVSKQGDANIVVDSFVGDGSTSVYVLSSEVFDADQVLVFVGNIYQVPTTNYTVSTVGGVSSITFTSAPPNTTSINVIHNLASTTVS